METLAKLIGLVVFLGGCLSVYEGNQHRSKYPQETEGEI